MNLLTIGGVELHDLTKYSVRKQDLDSENSTRSETGYLTRERIRAGIHTLEVTVSRYTNEELATLLKALDPEVLSANFFFGTEKTISCYSSNQTIDLKSTAEGEPYWDISFNLVEY